MTRRLALLVLTGMLVPAACASEGKTKPFFFIHMSDPQLFMGSEKAWHRAIEHANRLRPAFVVVGGDLMNIHNDPAKVNWKEAERMAQAYLKGAKKLDKSIPLYNVAGNHDVCMTPTKETLAWYEKRFGPTRTAFRHGDVQFVVVESNLMKVPDKAPGAAKSQMQWLRKTLAETGTPPIRRRILFLHHPVCLKRLDEKPGYFTLLPETRKTLLELCEKHNVHAVFSGHYHRNALVKHGNIEFVTTASCGKALGRDPIGFRIVKVYPDRIEHAYHTFDKMPERVTLEK